ncbi:MAG TPA: ABC transporter ATP-binding protein [Conexibacter sp.]|nr:ABC transporter ATP-binding protein [Conexibacter sp.]
MNSENTAQTEGSHAYPRAAPLELRNVRKQYPGAARPAIEDLSLAIPAGEVCVLVGPSGCGKTTAMRLVNRMIDLTSGEILLDGASVMERKPAELRREIGYVIQQIGLFPHLTIADNVATVPRLLHWEKDRVAARVAELLELVSLPAELAERYPAQLSGGQRQRVGVARALAADPPLLLMDEPFGAIDPIARGRLQDELLQLQARVRKTIVFVTHDIDEAIKLGDRIAILREGGVLAQYAPPDELLAAPADEFVAQFVGVDRGLKRLALSRLADVELLPPNGDHAARTVDAATSLRDAASLMLADGNRPLTVVDGDGRAIGRVTLELISAALDRRPVAR